jgi:hypothetical protein
LRSTAPTFDVPDSPLHRAHLGKTTNQYATSGYPQICLSALVACGTRAVLDAAFGPRSNGETVYGKRLMRSVHAGMIVLLDRGFSSNAFLAAVAATEAAFLVRVTAVRKPPVLTRYDDGSFLSRFGDLKVRIIECEITITTSRGRPSGLDWRAGQVRRSILRHLYAYRDRGRLAARGLTGGGGRA